MMVAYQPPIIHRTINEAWRCEGHKAQSHPVRITIPRSIIAGSFAIVDHARDCASRSKAISLFFGAFICSFRHCE
jgi:hypothetical protein